MRWIESLTDTKDITLSKLWEIGASRWARGVEPACQCRRPKGAAGSVPGLGMSPEGGNGNPL